MEYNGIIIFGEMGSGKDTLADYIIEKENKVKKYGLSDIIRGMKPVVSVSPEWKNNERGFMQLVADKLREIDMNILNKYALGKMIQDNAGTGRDYPGPQMGRDKREPEKGKPEDHSNDRRRKDQG